MSKANGEKEKFLFWDVLYVDRYYNQASNFLRSELNYLKDNDLEFSRRKYQNYEQELLERVFTSNLDYLQDNPSWIYNTRVLIAFFAGFTHVSTILDGVFEWHFLNEKSVYVLLISLMICAVCTWLNYQDLSSHKRIRRDTAAMYLELKHRKLEPIRNENYDNFKSRSSI